MNQATTNGKTEYYLRGTLDTLNNKFRVISIYYTVNTSLNPHMDKGLPQKTLTHIVLYDNNKVISLKRSEYRKIRKQLKNSNKMFYNIVARNISMTGY
jgi:hypothetical protein